VPVGTACMRRIGPDTAEIKRTYVQPSQRRAGVGRAMLDRLIAAVRTAGYQRIRLDSPDFMTAAHGLYRSSGFVETEPYPESEIPDRYKPHRLFMELRPTRVGSLRSRLGKSGAGRNLVRWETGSRLEAAGEVEE
jgi:ribosomal protein S18 acetylase RimI-like enzyme